jgi:5-amino-6-(5-phospho-D-ribitylamino)uracil phosphatase
VAKNGLNETEDGGIPLSRGGEGRRVRYKMLALDVDGTLLDRVGALRPSTVKAVALAARAGIRPVLCTGRRYRRARPVAEQLGIDAPIVCNSGAVVKEPAGHGTLWRADFDVPLLVEILAVFHEHDEPVVSFTDLDPDAYDFLVEHHATGRPLFDDYLDQNREHAGVRAGWTTALAAELPLDHNHNHNHFHLCAIGSRAGMLDFERVVHDRLGGRVRTFVQRSPRYAGTMCEVIRHDASKWAAVLQVARLWGVAPGEICAVGDDMNDLPMIVGAGLGVAMGHAPESVLAAADHVTGDHDEDGVAMLVHEVLLDGVVE